MLNCPRPDKVAFESKSEAKRALKRTRKHPNTSHPNTLRVYQCVCGMWHLGNLSEEQREQLKQTRDREQSRLLREFEAHAKA